MQKTAVCLLVLTLTMVLTRQAFAQTAANTFIYSVPNQGGATMQTADTGSVVTGYGQVDPSGGTTPSGMAILGLRQNGVLVSEAGVPGMRAMLSGRMYAEVN